MRIKRATAPALAAGYIDRLGTPCKNSRSACA
jgi:hypothetical protein